VLRREIELLRDLVEELGGCVEPVAHRAASCA
jgi:hypothetical protein